jgi:hypothetical protein
VIQGKYQDEDKLTAVVVFENDEDWEVVNPGTKVMFLNNDCLEVITEGGKPKHLKDEDYSNSITIQELLDHYYNDKS